MNVNNNFKVIWKFYQELKKIFRVWKVCFFCCVFVIFLESLISSI